MAKHDAFIKDFKKILDKIPDKQSLAQWQYDYRQVIYLMGLQILERFPADVVGPDPSGRRKDVERLEKSGGGNIVNPDGDKGGVHPSTVCKLVCAVLDVQS